MILKNYFKHVLISVICYFLLALVFCFYLIKLNNLSYLSEFHFLRFDAILYQDIKNNGYNHDWLCAFFPAFPFFWRILNISAIGISVVNSAIFILSISAISTLYKLSLKNQLFFLTIPSLVFMFVPYTESLFFGTCTLIIIGLKKENPGLALLGLFLASFIRPTTFVFVPAIIGSIFLSEENLPKGIKKSILPVLVLLMGLFLTVVIHFNYTNKWFVFFEAQKLWQNHLHLPRLPLRSWGGDASTRFDGSVILVSLLCAYYIGIIFTKWLKKQTLVSNEVIFAVLYIFGTTFLILSYRDGNLYSLNRFIYATPFIIVLFHHFFNEYRFRWKDVWFLIIISELIWLLFNSYNHIHNFLLFSAVTAYFVFILLSKHPNKIIANSFMIVLILINSFGLIKLAYRFLNGGWIG